MLVSAEMAMDARICLQQRVRHLWKSNRVLYYRIAEKTMENKVSEANLHIYIHDTGTPQGVDEDQPTLDSGGSDEDERLLTLNIQISSVTKTNDVFTSNVVASAGVVITRGEEKKGKWVKVDVTKVVAEWFALPRNVLGLVVRARDSERRRIAVPEGKGDNTDDMPYLEVFLEDTSRRRTKRSLGLICNDDSQESRCCRYPLTVDFEAFGWDWIIAPKKYEANFCMGDCPFSFMEKHHSTHIVHLASPPGYGGPCCTPQKMSSISLLHFGHDFNIKLNVLKAMSVEKCSCA